MFARLPRVFLRVVKSTVRMNFAWSASPFAMFSDNLKYSKTLHTEARFLQELSRINEFHVKTHDFITEAQQKNSNSKASKPLASFSNQSLLSKENRTTSRSVSCLRGKKISSSRTVVKVCSKMIPSKTVLKDSKLSETEINLENDSLPSTSFVIPNEGNLAAEEDADVDINWKSFDCRKKGKSSSFGKKKVRSKNIQDRVTGEPLFSCPFELVDIYPFKKKCSKNGDGGVSNARKEENLIKSCSKEDNEFLKSADAEQHDCLLSDTRLNKVVGCAQQGDGASEKNFHRLSSENLKNKNTLVEPSRVLQDLNRLKIETDITKTNEASSNSIFEENGKFNLKEIEEKSEKTDLKRSEGSKNPSTNCNKFVNDLISPEMQAENKVIMVNQEKDDPVKSQSASSTSLSQSSTSDSNIIRQDSTSSNDSETSGSTKSEQSNITELSETELSSAENTIIELKTRKSDPETNIPITDSPTEKKMKIIIEKRGNKKDNVDSRAITGNRISFYDKDVRTLKTDDEKPEESRETQKKKTESEIKVSNNGIMKPDKELKGLNPEDMKLSTILTRIYQHLVCDWQRLKCVRMKLQGLDSTDSDDFIATIRRLGKTIARCVKCMII